MTLEQNRRLNEIVNFYGEDDQVDMCLEEMAELEKALLKLRRYMKQVKGNVDPEKVRELRAKIIDETADVEIMTAQIKIIYNSMGETEDRIRYKIERQMERMRDESRTD